MGARERAEATVRAQTPGLGMQRNEIAARLGAILREKLQLNRATGPVGEETGLLGQGFGLDSIEILQVVVAVEAEFGLTVDDDELRPEHFLTVGDLVTFIQRRLPS